MICVAGLTSIDIPHEHARPQGSMSYEYGRHQEPRPHEFGRPNLSSIHNHLLI